ncbi:MAG: hypothetical protein ACOC3V_02765, partial [bacterium]
MKITVKQFNKILEEVKEKEQPKILREIFSYKENIDLFAYYMYPDVINKKIPFFHYDLYDMLFRNCNDSYAAPRGHGKSTTCGLVFISYSIVNKLDKYIVYISQSHSKTVQFISPLRNAFKRNNRLKFVYGDLDPQNGKDTDGRDREDCIDIDGIRVEAVSFEKNLRGFNYNNQRPTLIVLDDIEDDERVLNPDLRKKDSDKLNKAIINALSVDGRYKFIGTILHIDSLLLNKIKQNNGKIFKAIDSNGNILFPELYSKKKLDLIKKDIGSLAFQQEYLNDPSDNESSLIKREWIINSFNSNLSMDECAKYHFDTTALGVDFAFSDRVTADKSAFVSLGYLDSKFYIFQGSTKKGMSIYEQLDYIKNGLHLAHRYKIIALEENSIKAVSKDLDSLDLPIKLYWTGSSDPAEKKKEDNFRNKRNTVGKINLITRLGTAFENGL